MTGEHVAGAVDERAGRRRAAGHALEEPGPQPLTALHEVGAQPRLDHPRRRRHERERMRVGGADPAGQVDDPEHLAGLGIVHGRAGAGPPVDAAAEVLGGEDLDRVVDGDRGADAVRPGRLLAPEPAGDEADVLGGRQHAGMTRRTTGGSRRRRR